MQINVGDFVKESWEDYKSPTTSTFTSKMGHCRHTVSSLEETLDIDRSGLTKMKKSVKALYNSGTSHVNNESILAENLERLGNHAKIRENEADISAAFMKFSHVTKELAAMMKNLMQSLQNIMLFPLDQFLKGDLKGVKGDLKKPFDKAWKEYEAKFSKIEKEKKQQAKEVGMIRTEVSGAEIADEMEKERKIFQLHMCEYLIKINEIRTKKGVDLLQYLVEYYQAQANFFQEGVKTINHFHGFIEELVMQLKKIKQRQDNERKQLIELRDALKSSMSSYKEPQPQPTNSTNPGYSLHQLQGNKIYGSEKTGHLLKKSEGRMRRVWQKRRCIIKDGLLFISHHDESKDPVKLNLLTCQVKLVHDDPGKKCFDLISSSNNRTYHFQADDVKDMEAWISVLNNAKEEVLLKAFQDSSNSPSLNQNVRELTNSIIDRVKRLPGNKYCCDCGMPDPEWLSTNLGVLICLECCGIHRQMGVHISRTQSIVIDELGTSQLLLARVVGNSNFNDIMEATLDPTLKPKPTSHMDERRDFIRAKYEHHKYAIITCSDKDDLKQDLRQAIMSKDIFALLQVYAEDLDLMCVLPDMDNEETALHLAIREEDGSSLPLVDFIVQNSGIGSLQKRTQDGNTALHLCAELNRTECLKLLLRTRPDLGNIENENGKTAMEIAKEHNHQLCADLLKTTLTAKKDQFLHVNVDWDLMNEERLYDYGDYSDDDLDGTPDKGKPRSRPPSLIVLPESGLFGNKDGHSSRERLDSDSTKHPPPPPPAGNKPRIPGLNAPNSQGGSGQNGMSASSMLQSSQSLDQNHPSLPPLPPRSKKPPPPPPPTSAAPGHVRNRSEPDASYLVHKRTASDPPPRPAPPDHRNTINIPAGAKLVLPVPGIPGNGSSRFSQIERSSSREEPRYVRSQSIDRPDSDGRDVPPPIPNPRLKGRKSSISRRRYRAVYDCDADNEDELTFKEGEIILVVEETEEEWWKGEVEGYPHRRGLFPVSFVSILPEG